MIAPRFLARAATSLALAGLVVVPAAAQSPSTPPAATPSPSAPSTQGPSQPFAPEWGMLAGWDVFANKGCGKCHSVRGVGGKVGPDLARVDTGKSFFQLGAAMWNHLPKMGARMREAGIDRPTLTPNEMANLISFLFTAQYADEQGDAKAGEKLFTSKGCAQCHTVGGAGGKVGPALDVLKRANSPVLVAAAMWNHGPRMAEEMQKRGIARPSFEGNELVDVIAYIKAAGSDTSTDTQQVVPGTPDRGKKLFADKKCGACHAVGGQGPRVGPDLGQPGHHVSLTDFAGRMWNHEPTMAAKMKERGIDFPQLTGQEMADVLAYLYVSRYFEPTASVAHGAELVKTRGCLGCHSVRGSGATVAADFAQSRVVRTPSGLVAGMWNHSRLMERQVEKREVKWPVLSGQDLADISAYLSTVASAPSKKPAAKK